MPDYADHEPSQYLTYEQMNLINDFRLHVLELALWSRILASAMKFQTDSVDEIYERLLRVPADLYDNMASFYGKETAEHFLTLLTQHIIIYRDLIEALLAGDNSTADESLRGWYQNADDIATFLASINLYWERGQWQNLLYQYLQMLGTEVLAIITGDYKREIEIFDRVVYHTTLLADYLSRGIMYNLATMPPIPSPEESQPESSQPESSQPIGTSPAGASSQSGLEQYGFRGLRR